MSLAYKDLSGKQNLGVYICTIYWPLPHVAVGHGAVTCLDQCIYYKYEINNRIWSHYEKIIDDSLICILIT